MTDINPPVCEHTLPDDRQIIYAQDLDDYLIIAEDGSVIPAVTARFVRQSSLSEEDCETLDQGNDNLNWDVACRRGSLIVQLVLL